MFAALTPSLNSTRSKNKLTGKFKSWFGKQVRTKIIKDDTLLKVVDTSISMEILLPDFMTSETSFFAFHEQYDR